MRNVTRPSDNKICFASFTSSGRPAWFTEQISFVPSTSLVVNVKACPSSKHTLPSLNRPRRISEPFVSSINATGMPVLSDANRTNSMRFACSSWVPWEKLNRATFIPARNKDSTISKVSVLGPMVQTIFVFLSISISL